MIKIALIGFLSGLTASMGLGGGMVLILFLTLVMNVSQLEAQGINLAFFLPIAIISVIAHCRRGLINIKEIIPAIITGVLAAVISSKFSANLGNEILKKVFGGAVILVGIIQFIGSIKTKTKSNKKNSE